jgi:hypothetical protein
MVYIAHRIMCCAADTISCVVASKIGNLIANPLVTDNLKCKDLSKFERSSIQNLSQYLQL